VRNYRLKLPGKETYINVAADVGYDASRGGVYVERGIYIDGVPVDTRNLTRAVQRWLKRELGNADCCLRGFGSLQCPHGRYLLREPCGDCL
jgi:hypothetical protein